jgi:hypothetical protein
MSIFYQCRIRKIRRFQTVPVLATCTDVWNQIHYCRGCQSIRHLLDNLQTWVALSSGLFANTDIATDRYSDTGSCDTPQLLKAMYYRAILLRSCSIWASHSGGCESPLFRNVTSPWQMFTRLTLLDPEDTACSSETSVKYQNIQSHPRRQYTS